MLQGLFKLDREVCESQTVLGFIASLNAHDKSGDTSETHTSFTVLAF